MKNIFLLLMILSIPLCSAYSQNRTIKGRIIDKETNEALIGASVVVQGNEQIGTITNLDGDFILSIPDGKHKIVVSYIGYTSVTLNPKDSQIIKLAADALGLDEVVVVGYGSAKKRDLTGSVTSINSKKLMESPALSAAEAIQGKVPGVLVTNSSWGPGSNPSILIRGKRSIKAGNDPLYVVDGIPCSTASNMFAPSDIESIEVLKDASATAIYGSRGANGVILITTKKGKAGKISVDYSGYYGVQTKQNDLEYMNGAEFADYVREAERAAGKYKSDVPNIDEDRNLSAFTGDDYTWQSIAMAYDANGNYDPSKVRSTASDWKDLVEQTGIITDHQLSIKGGSDKVQFILNTTYFNNEGIYKQQDYTRYTIKGGFDAQVNSWLKVGAQQHFMRSIQNRGRNFQDCWRVNPLGRYYDDEGNLLQMTSGNDTQYWNPLQYLDENAIVNPLKINRFVGSYYVDIALPVKGLKYRANIGLDFHSKQDYSFTGPQANNGNINKAKNSTQQTFGYTIENLLFYDRTFGKHTFGVTLLQSVERNHREQLTDDVQGLPSDKLYWYDIASAAEITNFDSHNQIWSLASFMGRVNYNFNSKYYATVSMRYDGSSRLADGHKWVAFPAFSLAWRMNEESWLKSFDKLDNLKLRFGYGVTANTAIDPYQTKGLLGKKYYNYGSNLVMGYCSSSLADQGLTWETTGQWNLGLDFSFFRGRLSGTIDAYMQNTHDLLLDRQLPIVSGYDKVLTNIGKTKNKGIEVSLSTVNVQTKDFTWTTDLMYSTNKEEIVELYNGKVDDIGNKWFIGEALNLFYDYKKIGIWQNTPEDLEEMAKFNANGHKFAPGKIRLLDVDGDYKISADKDRMILGQQRPKHIFNMSNNFTYKGFDLNFVLYGTVGGMVQNKLRYGHQANRNNNLKYDYWTPNNPTNAYPRPDSSSNDVEYESTLHYEKTDFLRLKTVTLGYTLPKQSIQKVGLTNCRLYLTAENPLIFTNYNGIDPEGATAYSAPSVSSWMFGVNLSF